MGTLLPKGPLKRDEISTLMKDQMAAQNLEEESVESLSRKSTDLESYQTIDDSITQYFEPDNTESNAFFATLGAKVNIHFYSQRKGIDESRAVILSLALEKSQQNIDWGEAYEEEEGFDNYPHTAPSKAKFQVLPEVILSDKGLKRCIKELKETIYREHHLDFMRCASPKLESKVDETLSGFKVRLKDMLEDKKESEIEKLQVRYAKKEKTLVDRLSRAKERVEKESSDSTSSMIETGIAVLGALFGKSSPTKIGSALRKGSKILKERGDMSRAEERMVAVEEDIEALEYELEDKVDELNEKYNVDNCEIETYTMKARKTDIDVAHCAVVWRVNG